ncbi:MAG TPA: MBL fold metallo-hydrolase [Anaeromyxobacteraceae bacterium]|nr:MBL fold metallo-hydrolase [Anaeromyxobacteraceae bacterium]
MAGIIANGCASFGRRPDGARRARLERSPQWKDGRFENPQPLVNDMLGAMTGFLRASRHRTPAEPLPTVRVDPRLFGTPPPSGLRVTWLGHSTYLVELDGHRVLTDPIWSERSSPFGWAGPKRWYAAPMAIAELPPLDAVVISHDHYDHLDRATIVAMKELRTTFVVPLGVGSHLAYWGVPEARIVELDWWDVARVGGLEIVATPARHASGRSFPPGGNPTLWSGFALVGREHRAYYSGDTGLFPGLREIGRRLGPFDVTMIEAGAYGRYWPDWHLGPEQAVEAHAMVRGRVMLPAHWGLFNLAFHGWTEPVERVLVAAKKAGVTAVVPKPGESVEPTASPALVRWWPDLPGQSAEQDPIVSSKMDEAGRL